MKSWMIMDKRGGEGLNSKNDLRESIETPKISELLWEEFMEPLHLSAYKLANDIHVPVSRIQDILHDRRKITVDTSIRLGIYFGVSEKYFLDIQNDIDIRNAKHDMQEEFARIQAL